MNDMEKLLPDSDSSHGTSKVDWSRGSPPVPGDLPVEKEKSSKEKQFKEIIKGLADRIAQVMSESPGMGAYMLKQKRLCKRNQMKGKNRSIDTKLNAEREELISNRLADSDDENPDDKGANMLHQKQRCKKERLQILQHAMKDIK